MIKFISYAIPMVVVLALAVLFAVLTCKSKKSDLFKWPLIIIFVAFCFTWIIPNGQFQGTEFVTQGMTRLGLSNIPVLLFYAPYMSLTTMVYLLTLGGFYGVLSKSGSYASLVKSFASKVEKNKILFTIIFILFFAILSSILPNAFVILMFVPFVINVLLNAKFDKITTMGITFGSIIVGFLGATIGTDGLLWFNNYVNITDVTTGIWYRLAIGIVALVLFIFYNIYRITKFGKDEKPAKNSKDKKEKETIDEEKDDLFLAEKIDAKNEKKSASLWPAAIILILTLIFVLLGYVDWSGTLKINWFTDFHTFITEFAPFKIGGEDFAIIKEILGTQATAFGSYEITSLITYMLIMCLFISLISRIKFSDMLDSFGEGFKKMVKPTCLYLLVYVIFVIIYNSPFTSTISSWLYGLSSTFNPFIATLNAFILSIFHIDLGYTAYSLSQVFAALASDKMAVVQVIYVSVYSLVQLALPVGGILIIGLGYLKLNYKDWFKYIWLFALVMLVLVLLVAVLGVYVF